MFASKRRRTNSKKEGKKEVERKRERRGNPAKSRRTIEKNERESSRTRRE